jgi:hypothetical protein
VWKKVFHSVENWGGNFPCRGKNRPDFSTLWKKVFHTVENPAAGPQVHPRISRVRSLRVPMLR